MISISKTAPDAADNNVIIEKYRDDSDLFDASSRFAKVKTLDGGVVLNQDGYVEEDRFFNIVAVMSQADAATLRSIYKSETYVIVSIDGDVFTAAIARLNDRFGDINMRLDVLDKLTA